jgi:hypothetical protein
MLRAAGRALSRVAFVASLLAVFVACSKDDDDSRPKRKRHLDDDSDAAVSSSDASVAGGGGGGISLGWGCPFGLCSSGSGGGLGGGGGGSDDLCDRMKKIMESGTGPFAGKQDTGADSMRECREQMEKMKKSDPKQYATMVKCADTSTTMDQLVQCMMKDMLVDSGIGDPKPPPIPE